MASRRKPGISVLIATQNEEAVIRLCLASFLDFGDELVVVDNGSTDSTKDIIHAFRAAHPDKVHFHDVPDLPDLYHNRQYALEHSAYRWIVRVDGDFVAYTDGPNAVRDCRDYLLRHVRGVWPIGISVPLCNVSGDFWHTGQPHLPGGRNRTGQRSYIPPAMTGTRPRIYRYLPGFCFRRVGRWEATRYHRLYTYGAKRWSHPLWMHVNLKPDRHHFLRSERTNWRELGDFEHFPTLESYVRSVIAEKYGTDDLDEAARRYMSEQVLPHLERYDPDQHAPYPSLVRAQMARNPIYRIETDGPTRRRVYLGLDPDDAPAPAT
jgi:glycosyltransferase involved in cell wall biosynthesis